MNNQYKKPSSELKLNPIWQAWIDKSALGRIVNHPLLIALSEGRVDIEGIRTLLIQQHHYSRHFTKYLTTLISKLENISDTHSLLENLIEEMGAENGVSETHAEIFQDTLKAIHADINCEPAFHSTTNLATSVMNHCRSNDSVEGISALCLGAEAIVPIIYTPILKALKHHNIDISGTRFFTIHIEGDEDHAITMLKILTRITHEKPDARKKAIEVGTDVISKRCDMFDEIWRVICERKKTKDDHKNTSYSSSDFADVSSQMTVTIPDCLLHASVRINQNHTSKRLAEERRHKVSIINLPTKTISVTLGELDKNETTRMHRHNYETVIYVIVGSGHSFIGGRVINWKAGDAFYIPVWAPHQHINDSSETCVYLACENTPLLQNIGRIALREEM